MDGVGGCFVSPRLLFLSSRTHDGAIAVDGRNPATPKGWLKPYK